MQDRRQLLTGSFGAFCVYALLAEPAQRRRGITRVSAARWIARQDALAAPCATEPFRKPDGTTR